MKILISSSSKEPIYEQIYRQIKTFIINGDLSEGELLPSIRVLARDLGISVITSKRAYDELEADGFINIVPGKGSYVMVENLELLKEAKLREVEEDLFDLVKKAKTLDIVEEDLVKILNIAYREV